MSSPIENPSSKKQKKSRSSKFFLKGLAICIPPILTLVIIFWFFRMINDYAIVPIGTAVRYSIALVIEDTVPFDSVKQFPKEQLPPLDFCDRNYLLSVEFENELRRSRSLENIQGAEEILKQSDVKNEKPAVTEEKSADKKTSEKTVEESDEKTDTVAKKEKSRSDNNRPLRSAFAKPVSLQFIESRLDQVYVQFGGKAVPYNDYYEVASKIGLNNMPESATGLYMELVVARYFQGLFHLTVVMVLVTIVAVYFLGQLVTARLGQWFISNLESKILGKVPVVSNVYGSVKQVTDFVFSERQVEYSRVVAIEYPRRGIWALALVTSDSLMELTASAGEPLVTVLVPSSPMPVTGYTMSLPRKEVMDLDITVDQAFQFCISCGVLVPENQKVTPERIQAEIAKRLAGDGPVLPRKEAFHEGASQSFQYPAENIVSEELKKTNSEKKSTDEKSTGEKSPEDNTPESEST